MHLPAALYIKMVIEMTCPRCWMSFLVGGFRLQDICWQQLTSDHGTEHSHYRQGGNWIHKSPVARVYSGTGRYGSYFRLVGSLSERGLDGNEKLVQEGESEEHLNSHSASGNLVGRNTWMKSGSAHMRVTNKLLTNIIAFWWNGLKYQHCFFIFFDFKNCNFHSLTLPSIYLVAFLCFPWNFWF